MASTLLRLAVVLLAVVTPAAAVSINGAFSPVALGVDAGKDEEGGGIMACMGAAAELTTCTDEIFNYLFNGESTYMGTGCCHAVTTITRHCWSGMLAAVGYTDEEADALGAYCDAQAAGGAPSAAPPQAGPAPAPAPSTSTPCT